MRTAEIEVGARYGDGKGTVREVIAAGSQYVLYHSQTNKDCVRYRVIARGKRQPQAVGTEHNATRVSFAQWAKARV